MFNDGGFLERARAGKFREEVKASNHPSPQKSKQPYCTTSEILTYYDANTGLKVAEVHQYVRPDGSLGGSGLPDPKRLYNDGILYAVRR